jgi:hypothetical protein
MFISLRAPANGGGDGLFPIAIALGSRVADRNEKNTEIGNKTTQ